MLHYWADFFRDLVTVRGRSRNTVMAYERDLKLYKEYSEKYSNLDSFFEFLSQKKLSVRSQARVVSSLRTYFKYCQKQGESVEQELKFLKPPKSNNPPPKILSYDDFMKLFHSCVVANKDKTVRNQLTLMLLYGTGCRVSELIQINLIDLNLNEGHVILTGKGNKQRMIPLTDILREKLILFIQDHRPHLLKSDGQQSLLINDKGGRPSRVDVWRWLSAWSKKAGFLETVSPHSFRHGCATSLLEKGADLKTIQMLLGHSSIQTTQIYTEVTTEKLIEEVDKNHPINHMNP